MPPNHPLVCALVIGHKYSSPGAINQGSGTTEFQFNDDLARDIEARQSSITIQRVYRRTYASLPGDINELAPDFVVSLHCNAYNKRTSGCEVLYYHRSEPGEKMAGILSGKLAAALDLRNRGAKPRTVEDRGGYLLKYVDAPCVIAESFFIDHDSDLAVAKRRIRSLAGAYLTAIDEIAQALSPPATVRAAPPVTGTLQETEGWTSAVAHQVSIDYWARTYSDGYPGVLRDPHVKDMSFFNPEVSPEVRRNEMRIVVGGFMAFQAALLNPVQPEGYSEDEAFNLLVSQFTQGECQLSLSGYTADACYVFVDE